MGTICTTRTKGPATWVVILGERSAGVEHAGKAAMARKTDVEAALTVLLESA